LNKIKVAVIDYGIGNLLSVCKIFEFCGAKVSLTNKSNSIFDADRVVLPGVGAFADGMKELKARDLDSILLDLASRNTPLLGICLGMQMLLDESEEFGLTKGLGLIPGRVVPVPNVSTDGNPHKIPHIGWNELIPSESKSNWSGSVMQDIEKGETAYFVHSFMARTDNPDNRLADCNYGGIRIAATICRNNIIGCQFHPEKSGEVGLRIIKRFLN